MKIGGMKGLAAAVVIAALGAMALLCPGFAGQTWGDGVYPTDGVVSANKVNVRANPGTETPRMDTTILLVVYKGDKLKILGQQTDWYVVELPSDRSLWIHKDYVQQIPGGTAEIRGTSVKVRDGAGLDFESLGMVQSGRKVKVVGEEGDWVNVNYLPNEKAYIKMEYVTLTGQTTPTKPPEMPRPAIAQEEATKVLVTFKNAEMLYEAEVNKPSIENWKMDDAEKLYKEVAAKATDPLIKKTTADRLKFIGQVKEAQSSMVNPEEYRRKLRELEARIEAEFDQKRKEILARSATPTYLATGRLEKLGATFMKPGTAKLMDGEKMIYLLYSDKVKLEQFEGRYVGIVGEIDRTVKYGTPMVRVESVDVLEKKEPKEEK